MDPYKMKITAQWFRETVFKDEAIRPDPARSGEPLPPLLRAARSLENGRHQDWQSREAVFMKQGKLLAGYEDSYNFSGSPQRYYPTYQSLTDRELRGYFSWRTRLRRGEMEKTALSFVFLHIYELINQIGVSEPMEGYRRLLELRDAYGQLDGAVLPYLDRWIPDYVVYYGLDPALLSQSPQVLRDRSVTVLEQVRDADSAGIVQAVKVLAPKWLDRSKFYGEYREDMDAVMVGVLRRVSAHYAARCKKSMVEQYFGSAALQQIRLFDTAVFCDPLKRRSYTYTVDEQCVYRCEKGLWSVRRRSGAPRSGGKLEDLVKTIDAVLRQEFGYGHPLQAPSDTKWVIQAIREEAQARLAEKKAAEANKIVIDYAQLTKIRRDAALTREKLIVEEEEPEEAPAPPPNPPAAQADVLLSEAERRLLRCLLYGGDTGWVRAEGYLLAVLVDGINDKLYDTFLDAVLDGSPQVIDDYIDDLKEMVDP